MQLVAVCAAPCVLLLPATSYFTLRVLLMILHYAHVLPRRQDLLCWRGYALYDCAAEFRQYWLAAKLAEEEGGRLRELLAQVQPPPPPPPPPPRAGASAAAGAAGEQGGRRQRPGREGRSGRGAGRQGGAAGDEDVSMGGAGEDGVEAAGAEDEPYAPLATFRIVALPVQPCTQEGLRAAYGDPAQMLAAAAALAAGAGPDAGTGSGDLAMQADTHIGAPASAPAPLAAAGQGQAEVAGAAVDFMRDGLYLLHRQGHYVPGPTPSPLALLWKDLGCSR